MAAQSNRTVTLTLNANTTGTEGITDLASELKKLAKEGGDAAPEFDRLSKELDSIAKQQDAVNAMEALVTAIKGTTTTLQTAKKAADDEKVSLDTLRASLKLASDAENAQAAKLREATAARHASNVAHKEAKLVLDTFTAGLGGAKRVTDDLRDEYNRLKKAVADANLEWGAAKIGVANLTPEYVRLKAATKEVAESVDKQENEFRKATATATAATAEYTTLRDTLADVSARAAKLGVDIKNLSGEQNRLKQTTAQLTNAGTALKQSLVAPGEAALTSAQKIERAFAGTGVASVNKLEAEIRQINSALMKLATDATITGDEFDTAFARGKARIASLEAEIKKAGSTSQDTGNSFRSMFAQVAPATLIFNGVSAAIAAIGNAASQIPQVAVKFESIERSLRILTGTTASARKEMAYLNGVAQRTGGDIVSLSQAYIKLTAATKDTNLEGAQTRRTFEAITGAMGALGASADDTAGAVTAITQMMSKGVVSQEEMRQQLGERLPGALQAMAKEMGITTAELNELINSGKLASNDAIPALTRALETLYKTSEQNDSLAGQWNRFTTSLKVAAAAIGESGILQALIKVGQIGAGSIGTLVEGFLFAGKAALSVGDALRTWDVTKLDYAAEKARELKDRLYALFGGTEKTAKSTADLANAAKSAGDEFFVTAEGMRMLTRDALGASDSFIKFSVDNTRAANAAENLATVARKVAESTRASGEASITAANALGDEVDKRGTATVVAENNAAALMKVVAAETAVLAVMKEQAVERAKRLAETTGGDATQEKLLKELNDEIVKRTEVIAGIQKQADATRLLAEALKLEAETPKDNSGRLAELKQLHEEYTAALAQSRAEVEAGTISLKELAEVEDEARKVKALYIDALKDEAEKTKALGSQKKAQFDLDTASVNMAITLQKSALQTAKLRGDEYGVMQATNEIRKLEIQLIEIQAKQKKVEAEAILLTVKAERELLKTKGLLTDAKEAELKASEIGAQAKIKESEILQETTKQMKELADATYLYPGVAVLAAEGAEKLADQLDGVADSAARAAREVNGLSGTRVGGTGVRGTPAPGTLSADGFMSQMLGGGGSPSVTYQVDPTKRVTEVDNSSKLSSVPALQLLNQQQSAGAPATSAPAPTPVNITIGGRTQSLNVATPADAQQLTNILRMLESASSRTF